MPSTYSIKSTFSARHEGQRSTFVFPQTFSTIDHLIMYGILASFNDHIHYAKSVFLHCCLWLKSFLWFLKSCCSKSEIYIFFIVNLFSTSSLYIKFGVWHWFWRGQVFSTLQLHPYLQILAWSSDLLCPAVIDDILAMQL